MQGRPGRMDRCTRRAVLLGALAALAPRPAPAQDWIVAEIYAAAARYGVSGDWLLQVAICESGLNPYALNPVTGDSGLFQFNPSTWSSWGGGDIWNVWDQADLAAWAFSQGLSNHWLCA